jgi:polyisoprenyl-phosphate glycosyltransferase
LKIAAVLPAYNEAERVADVVRAVLACPCIDEVIVVDDGSTDDTRDVVASIAGVGLVTLSANRGKGGAMAAGARATDADVLVFLDADLIGLRADHVEALVAPLRSRRASMSVGRFRGGRRLTDWSQKLAPSISGQRAILRELFEQMPDIEDARFGVEMAITRFCRRYRVPTELVSLAGVTHPMKEEKLGWLRGCVSRSRMYYQIARIMVDPRPPRRVLPNLLRSLPRLDARDSSGQTPMVAWGRAHSIDEWRRRRHKTKAK